MKGLLVSIMFLKLKIAFFVQHYFTNLPFQKKTFLISDFQKLKSFSTLIRFHYYQLQFYCLRDTFIVNKLNFNSIYFQVIVVCILATTTSGASLSGNSLDDHYDTWLTHDKVLISYLSFIPYYKELVFCLDNQQFSVRF